MSATEIVSQAWSLYKANWQKLIVVSLVVAVVIAVISAIVINLGAAGLLISGLVGLAGYIILEAALTRATADMRDGNADLSIRGMFERVAPRLGAAIAAGILMLIALGIIVFILTFVAGAFGLVLAVIAGVLLLTLWIAVVPSVVLENKGAFEGFGRSQQLTTQNFGLSLGLVALTLLVSFVVGLILAFITAPLNATVQQLVTNVINLGFVTPFIVICWTLLYFVLAQRAGTGPGPEPAGRPPERGPPVGDR